MLYRSEVEAPLTLLYLSSVDVTAIKQAQLSLLPQSLIPSDSVLEVHNSITYLLSHALA
jgi:hypothetical protein